MPGQSGRLTRPLSCCHGTVLLHTITLWGATRATMSRLLKMIGLLCKRALQNRRYSAKETNNLKESTDRSHPITYLQIIIEYTTLYWDCGDQTLPFLPSLGHYTTLFWEVWDHTNLLWGCGRLHEHTLRLCHHPMTLFGDNILRWRKWNQRTYHSHDNCPVTQHPEVRLTQ